MNFCNKFFPLLLLFAFNISADELTINISGQTKEGVLSLAIYDNAEAYNYSVKGEKRSEEGIFSGMSSGGAATVALRLASQLEEGVIVSIVCDRGDRYLSSKLFD